MVILAVSLFPLFIVAQSPGRAVPADLNSALGTGDIVTLSGYFADELVIAIDGESKQVSKVDAVTRLRTFYGANPAKSFKQGSAAGSEVNGALTTANGEYKVHIQFADAADKRVITMLRFEK